MDDCVRVFHLFRNVTNQSPKANSAFHPSRVRTRAIHEHLVHDKALYKSTFTLPYLTFTVVAVYIKPTQFAIIILHVVGSRVPTCLTLSYPRSDHTNKAGKGLKMQNVKMTDQEARRKIAGHEKAGHKILVF